MTKDLRDKMESLRAVTSKLNASTDQASKIIQEVERLLGDELGVGVAAEAPTWFRTEPYEGDDQDEAGWQDDSGNTARPDVCHGLAYGRIGGKFRIHVVAELSGFKLGAAGYLERHTVILERTPWGSCNRQTKLESFAQLPALLEQIVKQAEDMIGKADETAAVVVDLLHALNRGGD